MIGLDEIVAFYFESHDFNGLTIAGDLPRENALAVAALVEQGFVQVVAGADFMNPHIRPWPSKRNEAEQIASLMAAAEGKGGAVCLYPTPAAMQGRNELNQYADQPYRLELARGRGQLELEYFTLDVLEHYRNDPKYYYEFADFEVEFGISSDAYDDPDEAGRDKITRIRAGFAYDQTTLSSEEVKRFVATFICDLADLTPEHQRRWESYSVSVRDNIRPHPVWWGAVIGGRWADGLGPFDKILREMEAINDMFERVWGRPLFRTTDRPREWGWLLRPTSSSWHEFVLTTDKLLSDNIDHEALSAAGVPRNNAEGNPAGSLARLRMLLVKHGMHEEGVQLVIEPISRVRKERQLPAHALTDPKTDGAVTAKQRDLLASVATALVALRYFLSSHPDLTDWEPPSYLEEEWYSL